MKNLTPIEFENAPSIVIFLYLCETLKKPVGSKILEQALEEHPEYFPDIVEHRAKWDKIPQQIHDDYEKEYLELDKELHKDLPPSKGSLYYIQNPEESEKINKKAEPLRKALHDKYYAEYDIEY